MAPAFAKGPYLSLSSLSCSYSKQGTSPDFTLHRGQILLGLSVPMNIKDARRGSYEKHMSCARIASILDGEACINLLRKSDCIQASHALQVFSDDVENFGPSGRIGRLNPSLQWLNESIVPNTGLPIVVGFTLG